ncbi:MAG: phosphoserine aminotransferase, partial [Rhodobacterales bacterium]|nr:phosphoserine aminotransferase [Rhodobacterales bacterium]
MNIEKPVARPDNAYFSSGPCAKYPTFSTNKLLSAAVGRSHRASVGKKKLKQLIDGVREILEVPSDYQVGIVPASDTGAVEMAMWSLLGARNTTMVAWESFGKDWINDVVNELKINPKIITADYGHIVDMSSIDYDNDVVFTWNGTTSGVCMKNGDDIPRIRKGLTICDATSAAFAIRLPFEKLDVTTFSWQKVMGGEAA